MAQTMEQTGASVMGASSLRGAQLRLARRAAPIALGEWLLAGCFRALCRVIEAAAQFCGIARMGEEASTAHAAHEQALTLDLWALYLAAPLPLGEIATAERERMCRAETAHSDAAEASSPASERRQHWLH